MQIVKKLSAKERQIIGEFFSEHRIQNAEIAKKMRTSKELITYHYGKLINEKIVRKVIPVINYAKLGYSTYRLQIKFNKLGLEKQQEFIDYVKTIPQTSWIVTLDGAWDIVLLFLIKTPGEFDSLYKNILGEYGSLFGKKLFTIVTKISHFSPNYLSQTRRQSFVTGGTQEKFALDPLARNILIHLLQDTRQPLLAIATKLKVSMNAVKYHVQQLEKQGIIVGYRPILDITALGFEHFKIVLEFHDPSKINLIREFLSIQTNVVYITESLGKYDLEFECEFERVQGVLILLQKIKDLTELKEFEIFYKNQEVIVNELPKEL